MGPSGGQAREGLPLTSGADALLLEIGSSFPGDVAEYPDIDMRAEPDRYVHKDGTPYDAQRMS